MDPNDLEIQRRIENSNLEMGRCAFATGRAGLVNFARLVGLFETIEDHRLIFYLTKIDAVLQSHCGCTPCTAKIFAFCEIFTASRLPTHNDVYRQHYENLTNDLLYIFEPRNYRMEVRIAIRNILRRYET